jgi:glycosyltransferase involved in cell wall biosynthesis
MPAVAVPRRIRVCSVVGDLFFGGGQSRILTLARNIDRQRFEHTIVTINRFDVEKDQRLGSLRDEFQATDIVVESLGKQHNKTRPNSLKLGDLKQSLCVWFHLINRLRRLIRERDIDVVDAHTEIASLIAPLACLGTKAKCVATQYHLTPWKSATKYLPGQLAFALTHTVITDSQVRCDEMYRWGVWRPSRFAVIPNGVALPLPTVSRTEVMKQVGLHDNGDRVIGQVSRLVRFKGHLTLLDAAREVLNTFPNVIFLFIGYYRNDSGYREELESRARKLGIADRVRVISYPGPIGDVWQLIDVHVHASWFDSLPNAIIEAMSLAKPSVVTSVGGIPEMVENESTGLIVPPKDPLKLANGLMRLLTDDGLARQLGRAAHIRYSERCRPEVMTGELEKIFSTLVESINGQKRRTGETTTTVE